MSVFDSASFLKSLTQSPGVYRMLDKDTQVLYVGKAKNLKRRVSSYFRSNLANPRTYAMVKQIRDIEVTVTHTEAEALLLENNLIKELKPRYNVLLRDDKSYPYIYLSTDDKYPRLSLYRGARKGKGEYFGPYPSAYTVRETLGLMQKIFKVRQCEDSFFNNRSRPCLQYQIKRCTAPCVERISPQEYAVDVEHTKRFLRGKSDDVIQDLVQRMEQASAALDFERAAHYRDQIEDLRQISEQQFVAGSEGDVDIIAVQQSAGLACVQLMMVRDGSSLGTRSFFPKHTDHLNDAEIIAAFIGQYYLTHPAPGLIVLSVEADGQDTLEEMLTIKEERKVRIAHNVRGERLRWLQLTQKNAEHAVTIRLNAKTGMLERFVALQDELQLDDMPQRIECFDISHTQGEATVASCVVFNQEGPLKSDYRRFNIEDIEPGDDYAAMHQAITRRYTRLKKGEGKLPDVLLIDGGKGQVNQALDVLRELQIDEVNVVGITKGEGRKAALDTLRLSDQSEPFILPHHSSALHLIQHLRDEAHRFAITGHRQRRDKARQRSPLEDIEGLGPKRRQSLLKNFGGIRGIERAGTDELAKVPGISRRLAQAIYDYFHHSNG